MKQRLGRLGRVSAFVHASLGLGVLFILVSLGLTACSVGAGVRTTTLGTGVTTTTINTSVTVTVLDTGYTTTSTTPPSVPASASGITPEQIKELVASWSNLSAKDWEVRDYKAFDDWAVAKLYASQLPGQIGKDGVGAVFQKTSGAWFFKGWVSVADPSNQQAVELENMGAPTEVWTYFGIESQPQTTSSSTSTTFPQPEPATPTTGVRIGVAIPGAILYKGRIYTGGGRIVGIASATPADLSVVGSGSAADVTGAPIPDSQYVIYAIKGIDPGNAIAVQFRAASNDGPVWVWLKYERKK